MERRREAKEKLAFLDAELTRIQEQVELVREQAVLSTDSETLSQRIDQVTATLGSTAQWISDQQKLYGAVEDLMSEPPALKIANDE
jgi:ABC-type transporter Mla subunit MlaD